MRLNQSNPMAIATPEDSPRRRVDKLNSLVQREVAGLLLRHIEFPLGVMVTVIRADVADDAETARIWLSVLPDERSEEALIIVNRQIGEVQKMLNRKLVMKFVPKLIFKLDHTQARASHITEVLDSLPPEELGKE